MVLNHQKSVRVKIRALDDFARRAARSLRLPDSAASICLVSDVQIAKWNRLYRGKNCPTDVLSFSAMDQANNANRSARLPRHRFQSRHETYLGDIAIAPAVAQRNARASRRSFDQEMRILTLHGLLHLMGYDHETDDGVMDRLEARLRRKLRIA